MADSTAVSLVSIMLGISVVLKFLTHYTCPEGNIKYAEKKITRIAFSLLFSQLSR